MRRGVLHLSGGYAIRCCTATPRDSITMTKTERRGDYGVWKLPAGHDDFVRVTASSKPVLRRKDQPLACCHRAVVFDRRAPSNWTGVYILGVEGGLAFKNLRQSGPEVVDCAGYGAAGIVDPAADRASRCICD